MKFQIILLLSFLITSGCKKHIKPPLPTPSKTYYQYEDNSSYEITQKGLIVNLNNPLKCPLRIWVNTNDTTTQKKFNQINPVTLPPETDSILTFTSIKDSDIKLSFGSCFGDINKKVQLGKIALPFPKGKKYNIIQGYNTNFTHKGNYSAHALDINLQINDTICAAADGVVVGVVKDYKYGGTSPRWDGYDNFITIYHPTLGMYTQYAHLIHKGSFVKVGNQVQQGDPIGLSGMTGYTDTPHVHFNCLIPFNRGCLKSIPVEFISGYRGRDLKRGDQVIHK